VKFAYYARLGPKQKATYRKSDAIVSVGLPDGAALSPLVSDLEACLSTGKCRRTAKAASVLVAAICRQLGVPAVRVTVRQVRPEISGGELHGLYTFSKGGKDSTIQVWMRTASHERVVRFRTFLRTLLHEIAHHLDITLFGLEESFHTEGFFRRESSLVRQLLRAPEPKPKKNAPPRKAVQLTLFGTRGRA
jgi:hypothetical protein